MSAATRRAAYLLVSRYIREGMEREQSRLSIAEGLEVARIRDAMLYAGGWSDGPGVAEHVDGEPPPVPCRDAACECHANGRQKAKVAPGTTNKANGHDGPWK